MLTRSPIPMYLCFLHVVIVTLCPQALGLPVTDDNPQEDVLDGDEETGIEERQSKIEFLDSLISRLQQNLQLDEMTSPEADAYVNDYQLLDNDVKRQFSSVSDQSTATLWRDTIQDKNNGLGYLFNSYKRQMGSLPQLRALKRNYNPYRYSNQRACDYTRLTADHIMEYLRSGKICGRRVSHVRFALSG